MKSVLFILSSMDVGGVEKSFLNLIKTIDTSKYEIHLGLLKHKGALLDQVPKNVKTHHLDFFEKNEAAMMGSPWTCIKTSLIKGNIIEAFIYAFFVYMNKYGLFRLQFFNYIFRKESILPQKFDIAIAYASPSEIIDYYVISKTQAKEKYTWLHFDIAKFGCNKEIIKALYPKFKKIVIVSESAKKSFDNLFPQFSYKTVIIRNVIDKEYITKSANSGESFNDDFSGLKILTVGRFSEEKGQILALEVAKIIKSSGIDFKWYFVGDGNRKYLEDCKTLTRLLGLESQIEFLGIKINPYPYMKDCDIYVQPSKHEGFCITLGEALCFDKPIVATDFCGAREQTKGRPNCIICSVNPDSIADAIIDTANRINPHV